MPRKTDSLNPAHWIEIVESDLAGIQSLSEREIAFEMCQSKLAEVLEKILKAELIRLGWPLVKTHDLDKLGGELAARHSDLTDRAMPLCEDLAEVYFFSRYAGFDRADPDWPDLRTKLTEVSALCAIVKARIEKDKGTHS